MISFEKLYLSMKELNIYEKTNV